MKIKATVHLRGIKPELLVGMMVVHDAYTESGAKFILTSCVDGAHMSGSLHYAGLAFDCRTQGVMSRTTVPALVQAIKEDLGPEWDVLLEDWDGPNEHVHVEFDPKH